VVHLLIFSNERIVGNPDTILRPGALSVQAVAKHSPIEREKTTAPDCSRYACRCAPTLLVLCASGRVVAAAAN
jgi:hypothetical protein